MTEPAVAALRATHLKKTFPTRRDLLGRVLERTIAVDGVDVAVYPRTTLGIVGESGSGKSTLARVLAMLIRPDSGTVEVDGVNIANMSGRRLKNIRAELQMIFQDPYGALDPSKTIGHAITESLVVHGRVKRSELQEVAEGLLTRVSLDPVLTRRRPDELSGGQRQRVCIARALALKPKVLLADEPTSALDLSTRAGILNLLLDLQQESGQAMVLVSHDFATIRHLAHRVAVMYMGRIVEEGPTEQIVSDPQHPYTRALLSAVLIPDPQIQRNRTRTVLKGDPPNPAHPPSGCNFRGRCPIAIPACAQIDPPLEPGPGESSVACIRASENVSATHTDHRPSRGAEPDA